jgi:hypothetical protein
VAIGLLRVPRPGRTGGRVRVHRSAADPGGARAAEVIESHMIEHSITEPGAWTVRRRQQGPNLTGRNRLGRVRVQASAGGTRAGRREATDIEDAMFVQLGVAASAKSQYETIVDSGCGVGAQCARRRGSRDAVPRRRQRDVRRAGRASESYPIGPWTIRRLATRFALDIDRMEPCGVAALRSLEKVVGVCAPACAAGVSPVGLCREGASRGACGPRCPRAMHFSRSPRDAGLREHPSRCTTRWTACSIRPTRSCPL